MRRMCDIGDWVCENCKSVMELTHVGRNKNRVHCPNCGNTYYVKDNSDYIGEDEDD